MENQPQQSPIEQAKSALSANVAPDGTPSVTMTPTAHNDLLKNIIKILLVLLNVGESIFHVSTGQAANGSVLPGVATGAGKEGGAPLAVAAPVDPAVKESAAAHSENQGAN